MKLDLQDNFEIKSIQNLLIIVTLLQRCIHDFSLHLVPSIFSGLVSFFTSNILLFSLIISPTNNVLLKQYVENKLIGFRLLLIDNSITVSRSQNYYNLYKKH